ncbi:PKD domain-containing protein [Halomicroarcula sp. GCM10025324]|uniref:PKD domain-containing protein n=1 Tax=Haloarcula TaxID=2237 RepID=UPI0023E81F3E|nr:PKD domain-containing protein [Halomicroarcula sp. ZS-22-S1]
MDSPERSRRYVLHLLGVGIAGSVAGCESESPAPGGPSNTKQTVVPSTDRPATETTAAAGDLPPGKLVPTDGDENDNFGNAVACSGDSALVGAIRDEAAAGSWSGATYVCAREGGQWSVGTKLTLSDGDEYDRFGNDVAIAGDYGLVGAFHDSDHGGKRAGAAYVFERTSDGEWTQQATLVPDDHQRRANFGSAVALDDARAVVGAAAASSENGEEAGAAYVFERADDAWTQRATLAPADGDEGDLFGTEVAQSGSVVAVGAPFDDDPNGRLGGSVYVFEVSDDDTWSEQATLVPDDGDTQDKFGRSLDLDGRRVVVGAPFDEDPNGEDAGSAYVFDGADGTWGLDAKLTYPDGIEGDQFGQAVAVAGDTVLVGGGAGPDFDAEHEGREMPGDGAGYVARFERHTDGWELESTLTAPDGDADDLFGVAVTLEGATALVGATGDEDPNGDGAGAAYVHKLDG